MSSASSFASITVVCLNPDVMCVHWLLAGASGCLAGPYLTSLMYSTTILPPRHIMAFTAKFDKFKKQHSSRVG